MLRGPYAGSSRKRNRRKRSADTAMCHDPVRVEDKRSTRTVDDRWLLRLAPTRNSL
jgi:hypothetical protein